MIPLSQYAKVCNKCCLVYIGDSEYILQQIIENKNYLQNIYPNIQISICCKDDLAKKYNLINKSDLKNYKNEFGYIREVKGIIN